MRYRSFRFRTGWLRRVSVPGRVCLFARGGRTCGSSARTRQLRLVLVRLPGSTDGTDTHTGFVRRQCLLLSVVSRSVVLVVEPILLLTTTDVFLC